METDIDLEKMIDERIAILKRSVPTYKRVVEQWQLQLTEVEDWYRRRRREFSRTTNSIISQYEARQIRDGQATTSHDHTYSRKTKHKYVPHHCHQGCWKKTSLSNWHSYSPLTVPLLLGWERAILRHSHQARQGRDSRHVPHVQYIAPCGRRLRSMDEVALFLEHTEVTTIDGRHFTFDPNCDVKSQLFDPRLARAKVFIPDISNGKERRPVSCMNNYSSETPEHFTYITKRTHEPSIQLHTERGFLVSCSCKDNCRNRSECECWQLTLQESVALSTRHSVGYVHRRLNREQHSAIYECNMYCSCGPSCGNRVVQNGLQNRLQVFKTEKMGWGLRTLDDIPKGTYICTYLGHIYTEQGGDEKAVHYGDEYFAELDYIEVMEHHKEGYESDVDDAMSECSVVSRVSSDQCSSYSVTAVGDMKVRLKKSSCKPSSPINISSDEEEDDDLMIIEDSPSFSSTPTPTLPLNGQPTIDPNPAHLGGEQPATPPRPRLPSTTAHLSPMRLQGMRTRRLFNEDFSYIMDAKNTGNLGRYVNHSCSPNTFVQNVFIDTHDLRFPWVALFAKKRIKALQELTWDYNYEVGSVAGKVIQCLCGAPNCRGRLL